MRRRTRQSALRPSEDRQTKDEGGTREGAALISLSAMPFPAGGVEGVRDQSDSCAHRRPQRGGSTGRAPYVSGAAQDDRRSLGVSEFWSLWVSRATRPEWLTGPRRTRRTNPGPRIPTTASALPRARRRTRAGGVSLSRWVTTESAGRADRTGSSATVKAAALESRTRAEESGLRRLSSLSTGSRDANTARGSTPCAAASRAAHNAVATDSSDPFTPRRPGVLRHPPAGITTTAPKAPECSPTPDDAPSRAEPRRGRGADVAADGHGRCGSRRRRPMRVPIDEAAPRMIADDDGRIPLGPRSAKATAHQPRRPPPLWRPGRNPRRAGGEVLSRRRFPRQHGPVRWHCLSPAGGRSPTRMRRVPGSDPSSNRPVDVDGLPEGWNPDPIRGYLALVATSPKPTLHVEDAPGRR